MLEIITTSDYSISIDNFWITEEEINRKKIEKKIENDNRIIIWLIIWLIRRKFIELHMTSIDFQHKEINNIIEVLNYPLIINQEFQTFEELWNHIFQKYDFEHIKPDFLCNETSMGTFLQSAQNFLNHSFDNQPKKTDVILSSIQEL